MTDVPTPEIVEDPGRPQAVIVNLGTVKRVPATYIYRPYIPRMRITMMDGDPGIGKSFLTIFMAAAVTRGRPLPGDDRLGAGLGKVLLLAGEDDLAETVVGRAEDMGADVDRIEVMTAVMKEGHEEVLFLDPDGLTAIEDALERVRPDLLIIDPVVNYLGGKIDTGKQNQVAAILLPLASLIAKYRCGAILTRHLNKSAMTKALYRGQMSIGFNSIARSVLVVGEDPNNPDDIVMGQIKCSLARKGPSQRFAIAEGQTGTTVLWAGESDLTGNEIVGEEVSERDAMTEARRFLKDALFEGPRPSRELLDEFKQLGGTERTFQRARSELGVEWERKGHPGGRGAGQIMLALPLNAEPIRRFGDETIRPLLPGLTPPSANGNGTIGGVNQGLDFGANSGNVGGDQTGTSINSAKDMFGGVNPADPLTMPYAPLDEEEI